MSQLSRASNRSRFRRSYNWTKSINTSLCPRGGIRL